MGTSAIIFVFLLLQGRSARSISPEVSQKEEEAEAKVMVWLTTEAGPSSRQQPPPDIR